VFVVLLVVVVVLGFVALMAMLPKLINRKYEEDR